MRNLINNAVDAAQIGFKSAVKQFTSHTQCDDVAELNKLVAELDSVPQPIPAGLFRQGEALKVEILDAINLALTTDEEYSRRAQLSIKVDRFKTAVTEVNQAERAIKRDLVLRPAPTTSFRWIYREGSLPLMHEILMDLKADVVKLYKDAPVATQLDMDDLVREINAAIGFLYKSQSEFPGVYHYVDIDWISIRARLESFQAAIAKAKHDDTWIRRFIATVDARLDGNNAMVEHKHRAGKRSGGKHRVAA